MSNSPSSSPLPVSPVKFYSPTKKAPTVRPPENDLKKNDIYYIIQRQSGYLKRKHVPGIPECIEERKKQKKFTASDRCYLGCRIIPNKENPYNDLRFGDKVFCGTFEKDGDLFITTVQDSLVRLYETNHANLKAIKSFHATDVGWSILDTSVSPDGKQLAYSSWSDSLRLLSLSGTSWEGTALDLQPAKSRFSVFSLTFAHDGEEIVCGASDSCLYTYNIEKQRKTLRVLVHDEEVNAVRFADKSSQILFTGGDDGLVKVWDRRTLNEFDPKPVGVLSGHRKGITFIDAKGDGRYLISNSKDQTIKLWDIRCCAKDEGIRASQDATRMHFWDYRWERPPRSLDDIGLLPGDCSVMTYRGHSVLQTLIRARFSPAHSTGQRYIYTGCSGGRVVIYDILKGTVKQIFSGHRGVVRDVSWHPYYPWIRSSSFDGTIKEFAYSNEYSLVNEETTEEEIFIPNIHRRQGMQNRFMSLLSSP